MWYIVLVLVVLQPQSYMVDMDAVPMDMGTANESRVRQYQYTVAQVYVSLKSQGWVG